MCGDRGCRGLCVGGRGSSLEHTISQSAALEQGQVCRVVENFAKLGGYEAVAADCDGSYDTSRATTAESDVIRDLQEGKSVDSDLLSIAEAKLIVRTMIAAEKHPTPTPHSSSAERVGDLLKDAAWTNPSEPHMREIVQELDHDQCKEVTLGDAK